MVSTPKRERDLSPDFSDVASGIPDHKRRLSEIQYGGKNGNAPVPLLGHRSVWGIINGDPLRGYPPSSVLYGMKTDSSLLTRPVFTARHEVGRDLPRPFNRGEQDPAILALEAGGAIRVPAEGIEMCTWNEGLQRLDITRPFKSRPELLHAYGLPPRRVADGAASHSWSYGTHLGPRATGQWSNMVEGSKQPPHAAGFAQDNLAGVTANPTGFSASRIAV